MRKMWPIVWRIEGDTAVKLPVRIIERNIDRVLVTSNVLKENDVVVVEGVQALREGGKVEVQNAEAMKQPPVPRELEPVAEPTIGDDGVPIRPDASVAPSTRDGKTAAAPRATGTRVE